MSHVETWKVWLKKISPLGPVFDPIDSSALIAMAEALALAAPQGPQGFPCVDPCRCDDAAHVGDLFECLMEEGLQFKMSQRDQLLTELTVALRMDRLQNARASREWDRDRVELAKFRNIVSAANAKVAHVRELYPNTWNVIKEHVK